VTLYDVFKIISGTLYEPSATVSGQQTNFKDKIVLFLLKFELIKFLIHYIMVLIGLNNHIQQPLNF
jgi:hypothetical protein